MLTRSDSESAVRERARAVAKAGGIEQALAKGLPKLIECSLSEALVLGLLKQGVRKYFAIFGHGSTDLGNVLRVYEDEGATRTINCRNEVEMAHAATALRWQYGEVSAVVTSIGPGAMQAFAGSLAAASNGVGVYHIYGDETTFGEGYNMQQVPKEEQGLFGRMTAVMGESYVLHTPEGIRDALRRGALCVNHPYRAGPFYLLLPLNTQPATLTVNLAGLPAKPDLPKLAPADDKAIDQAATIDRRGRAKSQSRLAAERAAMMRQCAGWRKRQVQRLCSRPVRPVCCPMRTRRTCMLEAPRARSAAITQWVKPNWLS